MNPSRSYLDVLAPDALAEARRISDRVLVDGEFRSGLADRSIDVIHPGDLSDIGSVPRCGGEDVDAAVRAAYRAFASWSQMPPRERGGALLRAADVIERNSSRLAEILALDTGNALRTQARPEVASCVDTLRLFGGLGSEIKGTVYPAGGDARILQFTSRRPLGVVAGIIPWNAPLFLFAAKIAPALVAGNTVVMKSAEQAPLCVLALAEMIDRELPKGVLNVLSGYGEECGKPLAEHPLTRKITFTGSLPVGIAVAEYAARKLCPVTLELGGKSPNVIMADADLDLAIQGIIDGMRFTRQGQACTAASRVFVHSSIRDRVVEAVVPELRKLRVGKPLEESSDIGAIISEEQYRRTQHYMDLAHGYPTMKILAGGESVSVANAAGGYYYAPTLLEGVPLESEVCREEIFGPVATLLPFSSFDEVIEMANATEFGLAANIWTRDLCRAMEFVDRMEAGLIQVNQCATPRANVSYGGLKMSGLGKENTLESMLEHFTCSKTVLMNPGTSALA